MAKRFMFICFGILALSILAPPAGAQPVFLLQWSASGDALTTDAAGNVYVADAGNYRIQKFTDTGVHVTDWAGVFGCGEGGCVLGPLALATDPTGNIYVAYYDGNPRTGIIQKLRNDGSYITQWITDAFGAMATDAAGDVYVTTYSDVIQDFDASGNLLTQWGGTRGGAPGQFYDPSGVATDAAGNVYVTDSGNYRIQKFSSTGTFISQWGGYGTGPGQFVFPTAVATDAENNVYVVDNDTDRVEMFTDAGVYITQWGTRGSATGQFSLASGVAVDRAGNIYVADKGNQRIEKFGFPPTPTRSSSWGRLKALYR